MGERVFIIDEARFENLLPDSRISKSARKEAKRTSAELTVAEPTVNRGKTSEMSSVTIKPKRASPKCFAQSSSVLVQATRRDD